MTPAGAWQCPQCGEAIEEPFAVCWQCGTDRQGKPDKAFRSLDDRTQPPLPEDGPGGRRPFQFNLRAIFILILIIGIMLGITRRSPMLVAVVFVGVLVANVLGILAGLIVTHVFRLPNDGSLRCDDPDEPTP